MMKKSFTTISIIAVIIFVAIVSIFAFVKSSSADEDKVSEVFEAQMNSIKGDDIGLKDLGIEEQYKDIAENFINKVQFSPIQLKAVEVAINDFNYKVVEVKTHENGDSDTYEVIYEVDAYPVVNSMSEYTNNPEKYLTPEQLELYKNGTDEEKVEMSIVLLEAYANNIEDITPVKERHSVSYVIDGSGNVVFAIGNSADDLVASILGMKTDYKID